MLAVVVLVAATVTGTRLSWAVGKGGLKGQTRHGGGEWEDG